MEIFFSLNNLKKIIKHKYFSYILFLVVAFLFIGRSIDFHFLTHFINGGDTQQCLNFRIFLNKGLYIWESSASGRIPPMSFWVIPYNLILQLIYFVTNHLILTVNIFWILLLYLLQLSFYLFYRLFITNKQAILAVLLTIFNIYFLIFFHTPVVFNLIGFLAFPLMYFLFHSFVFKKKFIYAFIYIVFQIILFRTLNMLILLNIFIPVIVFLINKKELLKDINKYTKKISIVWIGSVLIVSMFLVNSVIYFNSSMDNKSLNNYNADALSINTIYKLENLFKLTPNYGFLKNKGNEMPGLQGKDFSELYLNYFYFIIISFLFFGLFILSIFYTNNKRKIPKEKEKQVIILFFIIFYIFLAKGLNPPFEFANEFLYSNNIYLSFFRSGAKYFMFLIIPLTILYMIWRIRKNFFVCSLISIYILSHFILISFVSKPIHHNWNTILPLAYFQITSELKKFLDINKILIIPITDHFCGYTDYKDNYSGPDRLYSLSSKSFMIKMFSTTIPNNYTKLINELENKPELIGEYPNKLGYQYVLVEKDAIYSKYHKIKNYKLYLDELNPNRWDKIYENDDFILYKMKNEYFNGRMFTNNCSSFFRRINDTKYKIHIENIKEKQNLSFMETNHSGWKLYLKPSPTDSWCKPTKYYKNTKTTECEHTQKFFEGEELSYLYKKPIFNNTHKVVNDYANGWTINPEYIKKNFSKDYYKENPDGSIDVELVLYFKPQSYFYLGLIISGTTLLGCVGYLIYDWRKRRKLKS